MGNSIQYNAITWAARNVGMVTRINKPLLLPPKYILRHRDKESAR